MQPRDYQQACHDAVLDAWGIPPYHDGTRDVVRSTIANLATSSGKTVIAVMLTETVTQNSRDRLLFLADSDELCQQPLDKFRKMKRIYAAVEKAGERASMNSQVVVGSAQTFARKQRRERFQRDHFQYVIVDEAHRGSPRNKEITDYFDHAKVLGLTATAFRKKLADLSDFYDDVCFEIGVFDLIGQGYIVPIKVLTLPLKVDLSKVRKSQFMGEKDYNLDDLATSITPWYEAIAEAILEHAKDRHIVSYLPLIKSSERFVEVCQGTGINARHIDGQDPLREEKLEAFARGDFQLLSNSNLLTTGWDCPMADCMLNLRPTQSVGLFRQIAGRFIRVLDGLIDDLPLASQSAERIDRIASSTKPDALILDLLWQTEEMGLVGPASLIADSEEEAKEIQMRLRLGAGAGQNLQAVSKQVQLDREEELRRILSEKAERAAGLHDAREIGLLLGDRQLINYSPLMKWEKKKPTQKQSEYLQALGVNPDTVHSIGLASKILDAVTKRQRNGLAPIEAFKPLLEAGVEHPETLTLDEAIRALGETFPMTFGKRHHGTPLNRVPIGYLLWMVTTWNQGGLRDVERLHPAVFRYLRKRFHLESEAVSAT